MQTLIKCCFQMLWKWVMKALQLCLSKSTAICKWDFTVTCYQDRANIGSKKWTALVRVRSFEQSSLFKSEPRRTRKISKSKVTIAHVNAFFSFKLNAIIMFVIHIYYVPETYFTHSQRYGWIFHFFCQPWIFFPPALHFLPHQFYPATIYDAFLTRMQKSVTAYIIFKDWNRSNLLN